MHRRMEQEECLVCWFCVFFCSCAFDFGVVARAVHTVYVSAFYMDRTQVTQALWDEVYQWAIAHGYGFDNPGSGKAANHPVQSVSWYDVVKWCNARSEKEGRVPAYYRNAAQAFVYRGGRVDVKNERVKWDKGYRLPTEAEWEKAARGGTSGRRFPWSDTDTIQHARANYSSHSDDAYDTSLTRGYHPAFAVGGEPFTSPAGSFAPNGHGLFDMAGNVYELCWDLISADYYGKSPASDPQGVPVSDGSRVIRGGCWRGMARYCRTAHRFPVSPGLIRNDFVVSSPKVSRQAWLGMADFQGGVSTTFAVDQSLTQHLLLQNALLRSPALSLANYAVQVFRIPIDT